MVEYKSLFVCGVIFTALFFSIAFTPAAVNIVSFFKNASLLNVTTTDCYVGVVGSSRVLSKWLELSIFKDGLAGGMKLKGDLFGCSRETRDFILSLNNNIRKDNETELPYDVITNRLKYTCLTEIYTNNRKLVDLLQNYNQSNKTAPLTKEHNVNWECKEHQDIFKNVKQGEDYTWIDTKDLLQLFLKDVACDVEMFKKEVDLLQKLDSTEFENARILCDVRKSEEQSEEEWLLVTSITAIIMLVMLILGYSFKAIPRNEATLIKLETITESDTEVTEKKSSSERAQEDVEISVNNGFDTVCSCSVSESVTNVVESILMEVIDRAANAGVGDKADAGKLDMESEDDIGTACNDTKSAGGKLVRAKFGSSENSFFDTERGTKDPSTRMYDDSVIATGKELTPMESFLQPQMCKYNTSTRSALTITTKGFQQLLDKLCTKMTEDNHLITRDKTLLLYSEQGDSYATIVKDFIKFDKETKPYLAPKRASPFMTTNNVNYVYGLWDMKYSYQIEKGNENAKGETPDEKMEKRNDTPQQAEKGDIPKPSTQEKFNKSKAGHSRKPSRIPKMMLCTPIPTKSNSLQATSPNVQDHHIKSEIYIKGVQINAQQDRAISHGKQKAKKENNKLKEVNANSRNDAKENAVMMQDLEVQTIRKEHNIKTSNYTQEPRVVKPTTAGVNDAKNELTAIKTSDWRPLPLSYKNKAQHMPAFGSWMGTYEEVMKEFKDQLNRKKCIDDELNNERVSQTAIYKPSFIIRSPEIDKENRTSVKSNNENNIKNNNHFGKWMLSYDKLIAEFEDVLAEVKNNAFDLEITELTRPKSPLNKQCFELVSKFMTGINKVSPLHCSDNNETHAALNINIILGSLIDTLPSTEQTTNLDNNIQLPGHLNQKPNRQIVISIIDELLLEIEKNTDDVVSEREIAISVIEELLEGLDYGHLQVDISGEISVAHQTKSSKAVAKIWHAGYDLSFLETIAKRSAITLIERAIKEAKQVSKSLATDEIKSNERMLQVTKGNNTQSHFPSNDIHNQAMQAVAPLSNVHELPPSQSSETNDIRETISALNVNIILISLLDTLPSVKHTPTQGNIEQPAGTINQIRELLETSEKVTEDVNSEREIAMSIIDEILQGLDIVHIPTDISQRGTIEHETKSAKPVAESWHAGYDLSFLDTIAKRSVITRIRRVIKKDQQVSKELMRDQPGINHGEDPSEEPLSDDTESGRPIVISIIEELLQEVEVTLVSHKSEFRKPSSTSWHAFYYLIFLNKFAKQSAVTRLSRAIERDMLLNQGNSTPSTGILCSVSREKSNEEEPRRYPAMAKNQKGEKKSDDVFLLDSKHAAAMSIIDVLLDSIDLSRAQVCIPGKEINLSCSKVTSKVTEFWHAEYDLTFLKTTTRKLAWNRIERVIRRLMEIPNGEKQHDISYRNDLQLALLSDRSLLSNADSGRCIAISIVEETVQDVNVLLFPGNISRGNLITHHLETPNPATRVWYANYDLRFLGALTKKFEIVHIGKAIERAMHISKDQKPDDLQVDTLSTLSLGKAQSHASGEPKSSAHLAEKQLREECDDANDYAVVSDYSYPLVVSIIEECVQALDVSGPQISVSQMEVNTANSTDIRKNTAIWHSDYDLTFLKVITRQGAVTRIGKVIGKVMQIPVGYDGNHQENLPQKQWPKVIMPEYGLDKQLQEANPDTCKLVAKQLLEVKLSESACNQADNTDDVSLPQSQLEEHQKVIEISGELFDMDSGHQMARYIIDIILQGLDIVSSTGTNTNSPSLDQVIQESRNIMAGDKTGYSDSASLVGVISGSPLRYHNHENDVQPVLPFGSWMGRYEEVMKEFKDRMKSKIGISDEYIAERSMENSKRQKTQLLVDTVEDDKASSSVSFKVIDSDQKTRDIFPAGSKGEPDDIEQTSGDKSIADYPSKAKQDVSANWDRPIGSHALDTLEIPGTSQSKVKETCIATSSSDIYAVHAVSTANHIQQLPIANLAEEIHVEDTVSHTSLKNMVEKRTYLETFATSQNYAQEFGFPVCKANTTNYHMGAEIDCNEQVIRQHQVEDRPLPAAAREEASTRVEDESASPENTTPTGSYVEEYRMLSSVTKPSSSPLQAESSNPQDTATTQTYAEESTVDVSLSQMSLSQLRQYLLSHGVVSTFDIIRMEPDNHTKAIDFLEKVCLLMSRDDSTNVNTLMRRIAHHKLMTEQHQGWYHSALRRLSGFSSTVSEGASFVSIVSHGVLQTVRSVPNGAIHLMDNITPDNIWTLVRDNI